MQSIPNAISRFLQQNHVVSIATAANGEIWSACCFYVFEETAAQLIVLTSQTTHHGGLMLTNPQIASTIAGQPDSITKISGIQFNARAVLLDGEAAKSARARYVRVHAAARVMKSDVWALQLERIKFTDNKLVFAQKTLWQRDNYINS